MSELILPNGVYPAAITPLTSGDQIDEPSLLRLLAWFESAGCQGVVLAGTNGEGPSLSAVEKRDLLKAANLGKGKLRLILGIATPSLNEATWLAQQAAKHGATALLVMPPSYFRSVSEEAICQWFLALADKSPLPILAYNFPKMTGFTLSPEILSRLDRHSKIIGAKDSSGVRENLANYRSAMPNGQLFVGDETILGEALAEGWNGTISGAANLLCHGLVKFVTDPQQTQFELLLPLIETIRKQPQPACHKAALKKLGVIADSFVRLPLEPASPDEVLSLLDQRLGIAPGRLPV